MTPHHRGAEEARRAHNPKDGWSKQPDDILEDGHIKKMDVTDMCDGKAFSEGAHIKRVI